MVKAMDYEYERVCVHVRFPAWAIFFFFYMMMMVEQRAAAQASANRERRSAGMSAANVGASIIHVSGQKDVFAFFPETRGFYLSKAAQGIIKITYPQTAKEH